MSMLTKCNKYDDALKWETNTMDSVITPTCQHHDTNYVQNTARGFIYALAASYSVKVLGVIPALLIGNRSKKWIY
jgi:hypothetical protein